jgi:hypothetical protein
VQAHQEPAGLLPQRVLAQQPLGVPDRLAVLVTLLQQEGQPLQRVQEEVPQPVALLEQPVVVAAAQKVAAVAVHGLLQRVPRQRVLELGDVQPERRHGPPLQRARRHVEEPVGLRQRPPQVVEHVAQVRPRLTLGRVGPQQEREMLPRLRRVAVEQQVREQRLRPRGLERRQHGVPEPEVQLTEQPDAQDLGALGLRARGHRSGIRPPGVHLGPGAVSGRAAGGVNRPRPASLLRRSSRAGSAIPPRVVRRTASSGVPGPSGPVQSCPS